MKRCRQLEQIVMITKSQNKSISDQLVLKIQTHMFHDNFWKMDYQENLNNNYKYVCPPQPAAQEHEQRAALMLAATFGQTDGIMARHTDAMVSSCNAAAWEGEYEISSP